MVRDILREVSDALSRKEQMGALRNALLNTRERVRIALEGYTKQALEDLKEIRIRSLKNMHENIRILKERVEENGGLVYLAKDEEDACDYIVRLAKDRGVRLVVKSKSLTTEEIQLNKRLADADIRVVETDLGEWILQLANQRPSHIVAPAIHMSRHEIAKLINERLNVKLSPNPEEITRFARQYLRRKFLEADMAITGGNFLVAETGSLVIVTNEGNGRLVTALPPLHVAVVGVEKIVGTWDDAIKLLDILPKYSTGQKMTSYVTILNPGAEAILKDGKETRGELHLVLLDNGRLQALHDEVLQDALRCIRCSSCFNLCPAYSVLGGHVFGYIYSGPMGIAWTYIAHGLNKAAEIASLCISCGLCQDACPMDIKTPMISSYIKYRYGMAAGHSRLDRILSDHESFVKLASKTSPVSNFLTRLGPVKWLMEKLIGIDRRRQLPAFSRKTLADFVSEMKLRGGSGYKKAAYFADSMAYYSSIDVGLAAIDVLQRNDIDVVLMDQYGSGMPSVLYGLIDKAREVARYNVLRAYEYVEKGYDIVSTEPTAVYSFKYVYPEILRTRESEVVAERCYEFSGYLVNLLEEGKLKLDFKKYDGIKAFYHLPCHSRRIRSDLPALKLLNMLGIETTFVDYGCCGMAGTWGMRKGLKGYDISKAMAERMLKEISKSDADIVVTECSACRMQIEHFTKKIVLHPVIVLSRAYKELPLL